MKTGLFFGSFNPVHSGHMVIASYMAEFTDLERIWLVVSPHNPFKEKHTLLSDHHRLQMARIACEGNIKIKASNIEFDLPKPSFTVNTLIYLKEKYPETEFALIMGADNILTLPKWKNYEVITQNYDIYVYPRAGHETSADLSHISKRIRCIDAPIMELSSSFIRNAVKNKKDVRYMMPQVVYDYMREMHFYEK